MITGCCEMDYAQEIHNNLFNDIIVRGVDQATYYEDAYFKLLKRGLTINIAGNYSYLLSESIDR